MKLRAFIIMAFLMTAGAALAADEWSSFCFTDDGFAIDFFRAPLITKKSFNSETIVQADQYYSERGSYTFIVNATLLRNDLHEQIGSDDNLLRLLIDVFVANCASHNDRALLLQGVASREVSAEDCERGPAIKARYYLVGDWLYQVTVVGPSDLGNSTETLYFMDSFKIVGR